LIATSVLALNGASHLFTSTDPRLALAINPLNTNARVNALVAESADGVPSDLVPAAASLLRMAPGDARGYSMLGAAYAEAGRDEAADALFEQALLRSKTEIFALNSLYGRAVTNGDYATALAHADVILRRYGSQWEQMAPSLDAIAFEASGQAALVPILENDPPWRGRMLNLLLRNPGHVEFVRQLLLDRFAVGRPVPVGEVSMVINALIGYQAYGQAYRFYLRTLSEAERAVAGYIQNGSFSLPPGSKYFDWRYRRDPSADISFPSDRNGSQGEGLRVRFLESPARLGNLSQNLSLPAGRYGFAATIQARGLLAPKGLSWVISCPQSRTELARIEVPEGSYDERVVEVPVEVPSTACPLQTLTLETGIRTDSWRDRYSGTVSFSHLAMVRQ